MGFMIIKDSTTITPSRLGITAHMPITVIAVGSGAGSRTIKKPNGTIAVQGSFAGKAGNHGAPSGSGGGYGGGGGGGYGAGAGGAGGNDDDESTWNGGAGGGAGTVASGTFLLEDVNVPIVVTIANRGEPDSNGLASSFGTYLTAEGGKLDGGGQGGRGVGSSSSAKAGGGGGGAGGYQIGIFLNGGTGGAGGTPKISGKDGAGTGGGGGAGQSDTSNRPVGGVGHNGGGQGGGTGNVDSYLATDGYAYLGEAGKGIVLLFW